MNAYRKVEAQLQTFVNTVLESGIFIPSALWIVVWNDLTAGRNIVMKESMPLPGIEALSRITD
jgi:hypothetical protein